MLSSFTYGQKFCRSIESADASFCVMVLACSISYVRGSTAKANLDYVSILVHETFNSDLTSYNYVFIPHFWYFHLIFSVPTNKQNYMQLYVSSQLGSCFCSNTSEVFSVSRQSFSHRFQQKLEQSTGEDIYLCRVHCADSGVWIGV